ncbi:alpha/beta hydrolase [Halobacillus fulvus]|nr:alpha/beta hydrolase [Halobacillus fulvus]
MRKMDYGTLEQQFGELRLPKGDGPFPVAIVIHGGFWREPFQLDLMHDVAEDLTQHGWATWNIEYRRIGQEGGGWPGTFTDVAEAADYVKTLSQSHPLNLENVITIGHSAGGHLALWLAARHRLRTDSPLHTSDTPLPISTAVCLAGVSDLEKMYRVHHFRDDMLQLEANNPVQELLGGSPDQVQERFKEASPIEMLPLGVNQLIVHGSLDVHVPIGISDYYFQMAENIGDFIKYIELSEAEHFMLTDTSTEAWKKIREELEWLKH